MIERQKVQGRAATVAYLNDSMELVDKAKATLIKILFDDGNMVFAVPAKKAPLTFNPNHDEKGRFTTSGFAGTTPEKFITARNKSTRASFLSPLAPGDLTDHRLFMNKDGTVGFALSKDGDIQNVFNNSGVKGAGANAVREAIKQGGKTLDCFAGFLPAFYSKFGFEEYKRVKFDRRYAPKGWDYTSHGEPDIVYMRLKV